ncbi:MAG TPA: ATP synthase F1 subunit delta [Patescibacteria group bacterium]|nr:ATP synthase F1 subunit delta [Patescibacteria group bacterium]
MKFSPKQYAQALLESLSETAAKDHDKILDNFARILAQNGDLGRYDQIEQEFRKLQLAQNGIRQAEVTLAREAELNKGLLDELNRAVGGKLDIKQRVDESIIGGLVVRVDDTLIDGSVKTALDNLNHSLKS